MRDHNLRPQLVIPSSFEDCITYEMQIMYLKQYIEEVATGASSDIEQRVTAVENEIETIESQISKIDATLDKIDPDAITAALSQINSEITAIENDIRGINVTLASKQDILTFDDAPTTGSNNPVKSKGIKTALDAKQDTLTFDATPTANSTNPVTSGGVKTALDAVDSDITEIKHDINGLADEIDTKQDELIFDNAPTQNSPNPVTSGGIYTALGEIKSDISDISDNIGDINTELATKQDELTFDATPTFGSSNPVTSDGIKSYVDTGLNGKEDALTFDNTPTANSGNPVTSSGIKSYVDAVEGRVTTAENDIDNLEGGLTTLSEQVTNVEGDVGDLETAIQGKQDTLTFDSTPTSGSSNPVTSDGIYQAIQGGSGGGSLLIEVHNSVEYPNSYATDDVDVNTKIIAAMNDGKEVYVRITDVTASSAYNSKIVAPLCTYTYLQNGSTYELHSVTFSTIIDDNIDGNYVHVSYVVNHGINSVSFAIFTKVIQEQVIKDIQTASSATTLVNLTNYDDGIYRIILKRTGVAARSVRVGFDTKNYAILNVGAILSLYTTAQSGRSFVFVNPTKEHSVDTSTSKEVPGGVIFQTTAVAQKDVVKYGMFVTATEMKTALANKQNTLTFDSTPTSGSSNPVTSDGIYQAIQAGGGGVTLDDNVTDNSPNAVKSSGIYAALQGKQNTLTFDSTPTADSSNPVTSSGIKSYVDAVDGRVTTLSGRVTDAEDDIDALENAVQGKQNTLTFDSTPTAGSSNPVTSDGIYQALQPIAPQPIRGYLNHIQLTNNLLVDPSFYLYSNGKGTCYSDNMGQSVFFSCNEQLATNANTTISMISWLLNTEFHSVAEQIESMPSKLIILGYDSQDNVTCIITYDITSSSGIISQQPIHGCNFTATKVTASYQTDANNVEVTSVKCSVYFK